MNGVFGLSCERVGMSILSFCVFRIFMEINSGKCAPDECGCGPGRVNTEEGGRILNASASLMFT